MIIDLFIFYIDVISIAFGFMFTYSHSKHKQSLVRSKKVSFMRKRSSTVDLSEISSFRVRTSM
jgi:hypothetical protein